MINKVILFLYADLMSYIFGVITNLASQGCVVHIVHRGGKLENFDFLNVHKNIFLYKKDDFDKSKLADFALKINPDITIVSGWMDRSYLYVCKVLRKKGNKTVCAMDSKWNGRLKQWIFRIYCLIIFRKMHYSFAWVPGLPQYEYALKLGFKSKNIIFDLYTCDSTVFHINAPLICTIKKNNFLYVGRIAKEKNVDFLINVWNSLGDFNENWELLIVGGSGEALRRVVSKNIKYIDSCSPNILSEYMRLSKVLILPSLDEHWGVVIHEAASSGLVLLTSNNAGASTSFLINGFNGYLFDPSDVKSLRACLIKIINTPNSVLSEMGMRSRFLSRRVTTCTSAANLLSKLV